MNYLYDILYSNWYYAEDRVHPNQEAVDYIWRKFTETYLDDSTKTFLKKWARIRSAIQHRPFHLASKQHQAFLQKTIDELRAMKDTVDVSAELSLLESQLKE